MTKTEFDFETWLSALQSNVLDRTGIFFKDEDSARVDYDQGRDVYKVIEEIVLEYDSGEDD